ncbi:hypothetical protein C2I18_13525 [Paenibacillus sp. PK3_47]|nr:hypothetical protein C2I18_13525 [Paenibacillus sp. PK3_47]
MDTIMGYLNNMFASLPRTEQTYKLKEDLLSGMEDKYYELKKEGRSENEAVGIVISEFGNIDELIAELGLEQAREEEFNLPVLSDEEVTGYMAAKKRSGLLIGLGVMFCIVGVSLLILISTLVEEGVLSSFVSYDAGNILGLIALFILLVPAIGMFIYSGMKMDKYKYLENGFHLPYHLKTMVGHRQSAFSATYNLSLILGVCLCVLSPVPVFITSVFGDLASTYGVIMLLGIVSVAVFLFIYYGSIRDSFAKLLEDSRKIKADKEEDRVIGAVAAFIWPLATVIFLISGFVYGQWHINWVVFPVTALLFGMFSAVYSILRGKEAS